MVSESLPVRVQDWVRSYAPGAELAPIGGGITRTKWLVRCGDTDPLVLRWADEDVWGETGREHVRREALGLQLLADSALPVPHLLASDPDGRSTGGAVNLMTWRPGEVRLDPLSPPAIDDLATLAVAVHRHEIQLRGRPPTFAFRGPERPVVPEWTDHPGLWQHAIEIAGAGPPPTTSGLIHRDFHLGNVLWTGDRVSGLIDWAETSWGPADLDVAHLRADFAMMHGVGEAEAFREAYADAGGRLEPDPDADRFWVIADAIGFLPDPAHILPAVTVHRPDLTAEAVRRGLEDLLASILP